MGAVLSWLGGDELLLRLLLSEDCRRYATEAEARAGHDELVTLARTEHELTD